MLEFSCRCPLRLLSDFLNRKGKLWGGRSFAQTSPSSIDEKVYGQQHPDGTNDLRYRAKLKTAQVSTAKLDCLASGGGTRYRMEKPTAESFMSPYAAGSSGDTF